MTTFAYVPSYSTELTEEPKTLEAQFNDGYAQRMGDGINNIPMKWQLVFENITNTDGDAIRAFMRARGGVEPFDWTPPGMSSARFVCKSWRRLYVGPTTCNVTLVVEQDFAP